VFQRGGNLGTVVADFHKSLPNAQIYVYDNNSSDHTMQAAHDAGANIRSERGQGNGHVVRRMFADTCRSERRLIIDRTNTWFFRRQSE
jgi:hypothetical protein